MQEGASGKCSPYGSRKTLKFLHPSTQAPKHKSTLKNILYLKLVYVTQIFVPIINLGIKLKIFVILVRFHFKLWTPPNRNSWLEIFLLNDHLTSLVWTRTFFIMTNLVIWWYSLWNINIYIQIDDTWMRESLKVAKEKYQILEFQDSIQIY